MSHDGEVLVYATSASAKANEAQDLCVAYVPLPFPSKNADACQKASNRRKRPTAGAGSKQVPIEVDFDGLIAFPPSQRQVIPPTTSSRSTLPHRPSTVDIARRSVQDDDVMRDFPEVSDDTYTNADRPGEQSLPYITL